jgi:hypothetical protein
MATSKFVDEYAVVKAQIEALTKKADELKVKLLAIGEPEIEGKVFKVKINTFEQERLDTKVVRSYLTEEQLLAASKTITVTTVKVSARPGKAIAA